MSKRLIGDARWFDGSMDNSTETGVICFCGKMVIVKRCDLSDDGITFIKCPECGSIMTLIEQPLVPQNKKIDKKEK